MLYRASAWVFAAFTLLIPLFCFLWTQWLFDDMEMLRYENLFTVAAVVVWIPVNVYAFYAAWVLSTRRVPLGVFLDRTVTFLWYCAITGAAVPVAFCALQNVGDLVGLFAAIAPAAFALTGIGFITTYRGGDTTASRGRSRALTLSV